MPDPERLEGLLRLVRDKHAAWDDREDALHTIRRANEEADSSESAWRGDAVLTALESVATDERELATLQDAAGEALAYAWLNRGRLDHDVYARLAPHALAIATATIEQNRPGWLPA
jgi:hypothetical protein